MRVMEEVDVRRSLGFFMSSDILLSSLGVRHLVEY
ncbi:hypothetical protein M7I_2371 [Glarea lozoyensis 74030]|uniref:Uncharacterized protein n=1 Tax=Glarea lozoyensis (strain ATCC 74030 / MF5533) TaxID=1104152 RepID=H0EIL1_GLAL7|nr:hypothetical protein M7I_2371 [Glarea lozoyensis 74030]